MERIFAVIVLGLCSFTLVAGPDRDANVTAIGPGGNQTEAHHNDSNDDC